MREYKGKNIWPRGGMVDTKDLKSLPFMGVLVQVQSGLPKSLFTKLFF